MNTLNCIIGRLPSFFCAVFALTLALPLILEECLIHKGIILLHHFKHLLLAGLHHVPPDDQLLQDEVGLMKVEDEVELAHVSEVAVQYLHELVDDIQHYQLVVLLFHPCREIQTRIPVG